VIKRFYLHEVQPLLIMGSTFGLLKEASLTMGSTFGLLKEALLTMGSIHFD